MAGFLSEQPAGVLHTRILSSRSIVISIFLVYVTKLQR